MAELEQIVGRLERGDVPLAESITIYERGEALKKHCDALLKEAEARVEKIRLGAGGKPAAPSRSTWTEVAGGRAGIKPATLARTALLRRRLTAAD